MKLLSLAFSLVMAVSSLSVAGLVQAADGTAPEIEAQTAPLSSILRPDGSLDLAQGFSGSLDVKGYRMLTGADGTPRFVPEAGDPLRQASSLRAPGPESDPDDVYWSDGFDLTGTDGEVYAAVANGLGDVYIGGTFSAAGTAVANRVAKWDGSSWSGLGSGVNGEVRALAVSGGDVYAAGPFTAAGGVSANRIAKWNGSSWSALGTGVNNDVYALAVYGGDLVAAGRFTAAGGVSANRIAKWNGSSWSALGAGISDEVFALAASGGILYAGGRFTAAGGLGAMRIAKWNGSAWSPLGSGVDSWVYALAVSGTDLYAGGNFGKAGGTDGKVCGKVEWVVLVIAGWRDYRRSRCVCPHGRRGGRFVRRWVLRRCGRRASRQCREVERFIVVGAGHRNEPNGLRPRRDRRQGIRWRNLRIG